MASARSVCCIALASRLAVLVLQVLSNNAIPDHEPSKKDVYLLEKRTPEHHPLVQFLLGGFGNWDSEYYIMIAEHGHLYEQSLAFFPLLPWVMNMTSSIVYSCTGLSRMTIPARSMNLIMGWAVSNVAFLLATILLYQLTLKVYGSSKMAAMTSLLFVINPASVFMSSVYTESLFAMFSFAGMLCLETQHSWVAILLFALSGATRSNGVLALLYLAYYHYRRLVARGCSYLAPGVIVGVFQCAFIIAPYVLFQLYGYCIYCSVKGGGNSVNSLVALLCSSISLPAVVHQPTTHPPWCDQTLPHPYGYVQATYWGVGFLKYYQLKQIPNFLLATPMVLIGGLSLWAYFSACGERLPSLLMGRRFEKSKQDDERLATMGALMFFRCLRLLPYTLHLAFLIVFGVTSMHVQVLTRFIASSSPVVYWCAAGLLSNVVSMETAGDLCGLAKAVLIGDQNEEYSSPLIISRIILIYFYSYFILGILLHCNFLPWT